MPNRLFEPCIPTRGTKVPSGPDWIHEIKLDGYRVIVQREGKRVRLIVRTFCLLAINTLRSDGRWTSHMNSAI